MAYKELDAREADLRGEDKGNGTRSLVWCACIPQIWTRRQAIKQLQWARIRIERTGDRICISSLHYRSNIHSCVVWRRENDCVPAHRNPRQNKTYTRREQLLRHTIDIQRRIRAPRRVLWRLYSSRCQLSR